MSWEAQPGSHGAVHPMGTNWAARRVNELDRLLFEAPAQLSADNLVFLSPQDDKLGYG